MARLPQRLLGHPRGGALAVVGHVDRAWGTSFAWEGARQLATFESALTKLFAGDRLGFVMEDFNNRYAELSTEVATRIEAIKFREIVPPEELARLWTANSDARNYVVVGDPAVKLAVGTAPAVVAETGTQGTAAAHPEIETITLSTGPAAGAEPTSAAQSAAAAISCNAGGRSRCGCGRRSRAVRRCVMRWRIWNRPSTCSSVPSTRANPRQTPSGKPRSKVGTSRKNYSPARVQMRCNTGGYRASALQATYAIIQGALLSADAQLRAETNTFQKKSVHSRIHSHHLKKRPSVSYAI